jgi:hypothetical protein
MSLSVAILTLNEEKHLPDCLASVQWADEVLVLDSFSADRTLELARAMGARVEQRAFDHYAAQRDAALQMARGEWVLFVDADERVTDELRDEIQSLMTNHSLLNAGYWIPRHNLIFGGAVRHTGWYPDHQLRLVQRARARYDPQRPVHELVLLDGEAGILQGQLIHLNYETIDEFVRKQTDYAAYEAQRLQLQGLHAKPHNFILQPWREFRRRYISLEGYRDGWRGLVLSVLMAWYTLEVYRCLWRIGREIGKHENR